MAPANNVVKIFPKLRRLGRMPTDAEMAERWHASRQARIDAAFFASTWAYSHRQERLHSNGVPREPLHAANTGRYGSSVLGCRLGITEDDRFVITTGANFKLRPGDSDLIQYHPMHGYKLCSEPEAVINAIAYPIKCWRIYGLTLFSDNMQREDVSCIFPNIQHPCADCREFLSNFLAPNAPITVVRHTLPCDLGPGQEITMAPDGSSLLVEEWTYARIVELHQTARGRRSVAR